MVDSFVEWFQSKIDEIGENIKEAFIVVIMIAFVILTLPIWILPFIFWYFFVWRKENVDKEVVNQTNADRIRAMSDLELAEFMANKGGYIACCQCDYFNQEEEKCEAPPGWNCTKGYAEALIQKWLQSEVEE